MITLILINADSIARFLMYPRVPFYLLHVLDYVQVSSLITQRFMLRIVHTRTRMCIITLQS